MKVKNKESKNKQFKKGFTLLEMLVVVLIIGILAAVALPQYRIAVEKGRAAEVLMNIATIKREIQYYITAKGLPEKKVISYTDFATVDLSGGEWDESNFYNTKFFRYYADIQGNVGGYIEIERNVNVDDYYILQCTQNAGYCEDDEHMSDGWCCSCITQYSDFGRKMCKKVYEPLGFKYVDGEI